MTASSLDVLRAARARIADPAHWTKGVEARMSDGVACAAVSIHACSWCAVGAVLASECSDENEPMLVRKSGVVRAVLALEETIGDAVTKWNDAPWRTHVEVLAAFDRAIARELGQP